MRPGGSAARGTRSTALALVCAGAWLLHAPPPLLAENAATPDDQPEPVILVRPADGAGMPGGDGSGAEVGLAWQPLRLQAVWYFVEVLALGPGKPREVFTGYTRQTELRLRLDDIGQYAWRVMAVNRSSARYRVSPWRSFTIGGGP